MRECEEERVREGELEKEGVRGREKWTGRGGEREDRHSSQTSTCRRSASCTDRNRQTDRQRERLVEKG